MRPILAVLAGAALAAGSLAVAAPPSSALANSALASRALATRALATAVTSSAPDSSGTAGSSALASSPPAGAGPWAGALPAAPSGAPAGHVTTCGPTSGPDQAPWPDFDGDPVHSGDGVDVDHPAGRLHRQWETLQLDGAMYAQPIVAGGCMFVATENNSVYALDPATGAIRWYLHLAAPVTGGLPCGDIEPSGITGTPALDPATGDLWVVVLTDVSGRAQHEVVELNASNGRAIRTVKIAVPGREADAEQDRSGLVIANGNVYVAMGGLDGDCNNYVGAVVSVPEAGGRPGYWEVPTARQAGIWEPGGPDVLANGTLLVADGNGAASPGQRFDGSDAVVNLSPALKVVAYFAPRNWAQLNASDGDLGSTGPAVLPDGYGLQVGKQGIGYLIDLGRLGGVGGEVATADVCGGAGAFGADAVSGETAYVPCQNGVAKVQVAGRSLHVLWRSSAGGVGSPVVAGGRVWEETGGGRLDGIYEATGKVAQSWNFASPVTHFPWLVAVGGTLYAADGSRVVALSGL